MRSHVPQEKAQCPCMNAGLASHSPSRAHWLQSPPVWASTHGGGGDGGARGIGLPVATAAHSSLQLACMKGELVSHSPAFAHWAHSRALHSLSWPAPPPLADSSCRRRSREKLGLMPSPGRLLGCFAILLLRMVRHNA